MKYIIFRKGRWEVPVIFPNHFVHEMVARAMKDYTKQEKELLQVSSVPGLIPVAAGDVTFIGGVHCSGWSETLNLKSRGDEDAHIIEFNDYGAGHVG